MFLESAKAMPSLPEVKSPSKIKTILRGFFTKKRALKFFLLGLTFLFLSVFALYKYYYISFGLFFMILGAVSRLFGIAEKHINPEKLLD